MPQQQQPQQNTTSTVEQLKNATYWMLFLGRSMNASVEVFLRRDFGERYLGAQAAAAVPLIFVFGLFFPNCDPSPLFAFIGAYLVMCLRARAEAVLRCRRGVERLHSFYNGWPRMMRFFPKWPETKVKQYAEPAIVFLAGIFITDLSMPLGVYLMITSFWMLTVCAYLEGAQRLRAIDLNDSVLEQQALAERVREMNQDRF